MSRKPVLRRLGGAIALSIALSFGIASGKESGPKPVALPVPTIQTLPNGLTLAWFLSDTLPVIDIALMVRSGARDDPPGKSGLAELLSSTLDRGSGGLGAQEFAREVEKLGATRYVTAGEDSFTLGMHGLAPDGERLLELLAMLALKPALPEDEVRSELDRTLARWRNLPDHASSLAGLAFHRALTSGTAYSRGNLVSLKELASLGREDLVGFHRKHFTPANSVLMIVGRADQEKYLQEIRKHFGSWSGAVPERTVVNHRFAGLPAEKGEVLVVHRPGVNQAQVRIGMLAPRFQDSSRYPLAVANALLGEYFHSRLNLEIRDRLGLTYGIGSSISYAVDQGRFQISSSTRNEETGKLILATLKILTRLREGGIPEDEARMAREYLVGGFPLSVSTLGAVASRWLAGHIYGLGSEYLNEFVQKASQVSAKEAADAFRKHFDPKRMVIVVAGDADQVIPALKKSGFKTRRIEPQSLLGPKPRAQAPAGAAADSIRQLPSK